MIRPLCCVAALTTAAFAQDTSMFRGDAAHTGVHAGAPAETLAVKWAFHTHEPIVSSPVVANDTVFVGSADNFLYAVNASDGKLKWKFDAHGNVSSPAVTGGLAYIVSLDGNLYAIDAETGVQQWVFATEGERRSSATGVNYTAPRSEMMPDPWDFFLSAPTLADGTVYFGSGDHSVYAVDARTGKLRWRFITGNVVHASPAVAAGMVYVGSFDSFFYALDARNGDVVWKFKTGADENGHLMTGIPGSAAVVDGTVYFGARDANVYALEASTGKLKWQTSEKGSWVVSSPAVRDGRVYLTTSDTQKFQVLDAATGVEVYSLPTNVYSFSSPLLAGDRAYFGAFDGILREVDLRAQAYAQTFTVPGCDESRGRYLDADGRLINERVWIGDTLDDAIVGIRTRLFSLGSILSSPVIADGVIYVGSTDGTLYALGR